MTALVTGPDLIRIGNCSGFYGDRFSALREMLTGGEVTVRPAAARFGWGRTDYDQLAGAVVAGHIIECGTQATGGNTRSSPRSRI